MFIVKLLNNYIVSKYQNCVYIFNNKQSIRQQGNQRENEDSCSLVAMGQSMWCFNDLNSKASWHSFVDVQLKGPFHTPSSIQSQVLLVFSCVHQFATMPNPKIDICT